MPRVWTTRPYKAKDLRKLNPSFGAIGHFQFPKTLTFKTSRSAKPFLWKWVLFALEWKVIIISIASHLHYSTKLTMHVGQREGNLRYTKLTRIFQKLGLHTLN